MRARLRRLRFGLSTVLGIRKRGFFIPHRYADRLSRQGERPPYAALESLFAAQTQSFRAFLAGIDRHAAALLAIGNEKAPQPKWTQDWFPRLDAAAAYAMVREAKPRRIVEIGSGHSTRFLARAVREGGLATEMLAIDPEPRAAIEGTGFRIDRRMVQAVNPAEFAVLSAGDILFIDSSHILMPGTDVDVLFNRILPALRSGVRVHIHDVFLPDDYPAEWEWRGYNEQLAVAALLQGGAFALLWSSRYAVTRLADAVAGSVVSKLPVVSGAHESSLWLQKS